MAISSIGLGSGIDVKSIVSQMVELEKRPIVALQKKEASIQSQISTYSQMKSLMSTFADAASALTRDSGWNAMAVASTNPAAATATVSGVASAGSYSLEVSKLAQVQTSVSGTAVPSTASMGAGTLTLQVGTGDPVAITVDADTTLSGIAASINDKNAGVVATVINDASGQRLMVRGTTTGAQNAFTLSASSGFATAPAGALAFSATQAAQDTEAKLNNLPITSSTRDFAEVVPGLKFSVSSVTTAPVGITVTADNAATKKNVQAFVDAYNAVNDLIAKNTKYDADTKTAGLLQGDSTALGIQNILRTVVGTATEGGAFKTLSDAGVAVQRGGNLTLDGAKFDKALATDPAGLKNLFANATASTDSRGIAVKLKTLTATMLSFDGTFNSKTDALSLEDKRNQAQQDRVTARAAVLEKRLNAQYGALDTKMASIKSLDAYVNQQITNWNKNTN